MKKGLIWGVGLLVAVAVTIAFQWPDGKMRIIACDVGQGDAILITRGFNQILVDGGPDNGKAMVCLGEYMPFWDRQLELVAATHPDMDHIGGLPEIMERYKVKNVLMSDAGKKTEGFDSFYKAVRESSANLTIADRGMELKLGQMRLLVLSPDKDEGLLAQWYQNTTNLDQSVLGVSDVLEKVEVNDHSVVLLVTYGQTETLLAGDLTEAGEKELLKLKIVPDVDILKAGHHGSKTSTSVEWLGIIKPELVLISVSKNNRYGHPNEAVIKRIKSLGSRVLRTDELGSLVLVTDGIRIWQD